MGRFICKLDDGDRSYYLEWSTVVDAPVTNGMTLEEFVRYYRDKYGTDGMRDFPERMQRVEENGCSFFVMHSLKSLLSGNRAGEGETCLTKKQIIERYCRSTDNG